MSTKKNILQDLLITFMKIGAFTFGGGYAMISIIEDICVEKKQWITHDEMMNVTVIAESTPGPIAINCATFVGCRCAGFPGAVTATLGVILPSFCIIFLLSLYFDHFLEIPVIAHAFQGMKAGVGILICNAALTMIRKRTKAKKSALSTAIMTAAFLSMFFINLLSWNISSMSLMLAAGAVSLSLFLVREHGNGKAEG